MKRRLASSGYTITEVMIVLAVSGTLLTSVMTMISGQQRRTEFVTSVREAESKLQDIFNDVEAGFFTNSGRVKCTAASPSASSLIISAAATNVDQGTNQDCTFLGKAVQFYEDPTSNGISKYRVLVIAGKRQYEDNDGKIRDVSKIGDAVPTAFYDTSPANAANNIVETGNLRHGLRLTKIKYIGASVVDQETKGVAVLAAIGAGGKAGSGATAASNTPASNGGARLARLGITSSNGTSDADMLSAIRNLSSDSINDARQGIIICLSEGAGGRVAAVTVGVRVNPDNPSDLQTSGQRLSTEAYFDKDAEALSCSS